MPQQKKAQPAAQPQPKGAAKPRPIPANLVKVADRGHGRRPVPDTSAAIKKSAIVDGGSDLGRWDRVIMMSDDMKCYKFNSPGVIANPRMNTYVIDGTAKPCEFTEVLPELFGDQLGAAAAAAPKKAAGQQAKGKGKGKGRGRGKKAAPATTGSANAGAGKAAEE